jgi:hypothetical protein
MGMSRSTGGERSIHLAEPDHAKRLAMYASLVVGIDRRLSSAWRALTEALQVQLLGKAPSVRTAE